MPDHEFDPGDHAVIEPGHLCHDCGKPLEDHERLPSHLDSNSESIEHAIQRQMLERLGIAWPDGEPFYSIVETEILRLNVEVVRLRGMIRKHYPKIAGRVLQLQQAHEERAEAEWNAVAQDFAAVIVEEASHA